MTITNEIELKFKNFDQIVEHDYLICKKTPEFNEDIEKLYKRFLKNYSDILFTNERFLLHGDIYKNNLLLSDNGLKIIDPLGFKAPFVMELVSICAYEMFYNPKENIEILNDFINYFSYYTDEDTYKKALFCNLVKVYIPSIYEANDGGIRAAKWLKIIKELF